MTKLPLYYDMNGQRIPLTKLEKIADRRIAKTKLWRRHLRVTTSWLGLDHDWTWNFAKDGPNPRPLIFETVVSLYGKALYIERYVTKEEARGGHDRIAADFQNPAKAIAIIIKDRIENR